MLNWERRLIAIANDCICKDRFDILNLYLKLSNAAGDWISNKKYNIKEGVEFNVPCENGNILKFTFFVNTCELKMCNSISNENIILISKSDSAQKEYKAINLIGQTFKLSNQGLGKSRPKQMAALVADMKKGDCLSFEGRNTYLCLDKHKNQIHFLKIFGGDIENFDIDNLNHIEKISIDVYSEYDWQTFYSQNRLSAYGLIMPKLTESTSAQQYINKLHGTIKKHQTKQLQWGNLNILVRKKRIGKGLAWYINGQKTDENIIKLLYGYFNNNPKEYDFIRKEPDEEKEFTDLECHNYIAQLESEFKYAEIYNYLCDYIKSHKSDLKVDIKTFKPDKDGNYIAQKFAFSYENDKVKVYGITFENNNFNNDIQTITEVTAEEFSAFCVEVNKHNKILFFQEETKTIREKYSLDELNPIQEKIAQNLADKNNQKKSVIAQIKSRQFR